MACTTQIRVISAASGATVGTIPIGPLPVFATFGIAIAPDGRRLYATAWTGSCTGQAVKVIDTASGSVVASIGVPPFPGAIALAPDASALYVSHIGSSCTGVGTGTVSVINAASNTLAGSIGVAVNPMSLGVSPDGTRVFVPNNGSPFSVSIISRQTHTVSRLHPRRSSHARHRVHTDGSRAYAPWDEGVTIFNAVTHTRLGSIPINPAVEGQPRSLVILPVPPDPPTDLFAASIAGNQVTLQWRPPAAGARPTAYAVEGGVLPGETLATLLTGSSLPSYTFTAPSGSIPRARSRARRRSAERLFERDPNLGQPTVAAGGAGGARRPGQWARHRARLAQFSGWRPADRNGARCHRFAADDDSVASG